MGAGEKVCVLLLPSSPPAGVGSEVAGGDRNTVPENTSTNRRGESKYMASKFIANATELNPAQQNKASKLNSFESNTMCVCVCVCVCVCRREGTLKRLYNATQYLQPCLEGCWPCLDPIGTQWAHTLICMQMSDSWNVQYS